MSGSIIQDAREAQDFKEVRKRQKTYAAKEIKNILQYFSATEKEEILNKIK